MSAHRRYQQLVDRFEAAVRLNLGTLDRASDMCEVIAASQRTLSRAVRVIRGTTPARLVRLLRLAEARRALLSLPAGSETVTEVAMRFGLRELGRFAADYRAVFGESPSETVRRNAPAASHCPNKCLSDP